jgi:hypothetical protein
MRTVLDYTLTIASVVFYAASVLLSLMAVIFAVWMYVR